MAIAQERFLQTEELSLLPPEARGELYSVLEDIFSFDLEFRKQALDRLEVMDAHRRSPLAISILIHRLIEPDVKTRSKIIELIFASLQSAETNPRVRSHLRRSLSEIGVREIFALLEALSTQELLDQISYIFNQCSDADEFLTQLLLNRSEDISIRKAAAEVIGAVGYLEAKPAVISLEQHLSNLVSGQLPMSFAPRNARYAEELLPIVRRTLRALE